MPIRDKFITRIYSKHSNNSTNDVILEKMKMLEENNNFLKDSMQKDLMDISFKQMRLIETIDDILRYIMLMLLTFMLFDIGYITSVCASASITTLIWYGGKAIIFGATLIVIYILRKDLIN